MTTGIFADSNRVGLKYIAESVSAWGTIPVSGSVREMRLTSSSLAASKETKVSNEIRADRMVSSIIETGAMTEGDVNFEWSAGSFDDFIQAFVLGTWTRPMTFDRWAGEIVSITANNTIKVLGKDVRGYLSAGRYIKTEGFATPGNNGYWTISGTSLSGADTLIAITGTPLAAEAGTFYTRVMDANDVIVLNSTAIRSGTGSAQAFDSNGSNAFTAAIAAGQLVVGQNIFVEGLGRESGTVLFNNVSEVGDTITVDDGVNEPIAFVAGTDFAVGATATNSATNFQAAVNAKRVLGDLDVNATRSTATVTLKNLDNSGGAITETSDSWETGSVAFSGTATANDAVTIDDNINTPIQYVAKATGAGVHEFNIGASASDSGQNLKAAIAADILSGALSNISVSGAGATITIKSSTGGGSITEDVDFGTVITVVDFAVDNNTTVTNFTNGYASVRGIFKITELTNDIITVDSAVATINNSTIPVTIKGSMLRNPGDIDDIIPQSFDIETAFNDIGQYITQNGLRVGSYNLNVNTGAIVTGSLSFNGKETTGGNTPVLGSGTYTQLESTITEVMNATDNVGVIKKNGVVFTTAIQQIQLKGSASLRNQMAVSSKFPRGIGTGRFQLTGTVNAYFEDLSLWNEFINHETSSLQWDMNDVDANSYIFTLPALKFLTDPLGPGGIDQDVMEQINFNAFRDANTESMLQIDRFSSLNPV